MSRRCCHHDPQPCSAGNRLPRRFRISGLLFSLAALIAAIVVGAGWPDSGNAQTIPPEVDQSTLPQGALTFTDLRPISIESGILEMEGFWTKWEVVDRTGAFSVVRVTNNTNLFERHMSFVGPQLMNTKWRDSQGSGLQKVVALHQITPLPLPQKMAPMDGVPAEALNFVIVIERDGTRGPRVERITRRVLEPFVTHATVNGTLFRLRAFRLEVVTEVEGEGRRRVAQVEYVPLLGLPVRGRYKEPTEERWEFTNIRVNPLILQDLETLSLQ